MTRQELEQVIQNNILERVTASGSYTKEILSAVDEYVAGVIGPDYDLTKPYENNQRIHFEEFGNKLLAIQRKRAGLEGEK